MLARPEIGTRAHILLWVASKPPEEEYYWRDAQHCACGQYSKEFYGEAGAWTVTNPLLPIHEMNGHASAVMNPHTSCGTFGDLYRQLQLQWGNKL
jgi:hypothetical protein